MKVFKISKSSAPKLVLNYSKNIENKNGNLHTQLGGKPDEIYRCDYSAKQARAGA